MESITGSSRGNCGDKQGESSHGKKTYHRHTPHQIQVLEAYFKVNPHPDDKQRANLSNQLGLDANQIKFWFQNKRTQSKAQIGRADNSVLRAENERIECENQAIREALKNVFCPACAAKQRHNSHTDQLKQQNKVMSSLLAKYTGKEVSVSESVTSVVQTPSSGSMVMPLPRIERGFVSEAFISETAAAALDELIILLDNNEPMWVKSPPDGRYVIHQENYNKAFPRSSTHLPSSTARIESSKYYTLATMNAAELVHMFLDVDKWMDLFPTIVTEAKTIQVFETGMVGNKNGSTLQLMQEEIHVLSPFVPPREFDILRHCREIEPGCWVVLDVSYPFFKQPSYSWKYPSGCMIQQMPNGCSKVTWVEHVGVDDETHTSTHHLCRDIIVGGSPYGSERWVASLQRMCDRLSIVSNAGITRLITRPIDYIGTTGSRQRWNIMKVSQRMVKSFCSMLNMSADRSDFPQLSYDTDHRRGVRISVRHTAQTGQTEGIIVTAATSLWLPLPSQSVFTFIKDPRIRHQWDVLCNGYPVNVMANISTGNVAGNSISIIQPFVPSEKNMVVLQECCKCEFLEGMVVYAPMSFEAMNIAMDREGCLDEIPILPSGFIVSGAATAAANSGASLLTVAFQILVSTSSSFSTEQLNAQSVSTVKNLLTSTVQKLKAILGCSHLD